jgi:hypothetical protein
MLREHRASMSWVLMKAIRSSETSVDVHRNSGGYIPEGALYSHSYENLISRSL